MRHKIFLLAALSAFLLANISTAGKMNKKQLPEQTVAVPDTVMRNAVGDSIYRIIVNAKKVEIASLPLQSDSTGKIITKKISSKDLQLMKFIATNPKNYLSNKTVYGVFLPQFQATYSNKKESLTLKYDFGLRKWGIFNADDKEIAIFDLSSDNMLRFACKMFPDNQFLHDLLMTREQ